MLISAVILSYNSERYLEPCLRSLLDAMRDLPEDSEILVVENGSRDRSPDILRRFESSHPDSVTGFYYGENLGTTVSRNFALRQAKGRYILVLDSDVVTPTETLEPLIEVLESEPRCGLVAPRLVYPDGREQLSTDRFPTLWRKLTRLFSLKRMEEALPGGATASGPREVDYAISAFWLFHHRLLSEVGFLDERFFYAPDDVDYCLSIWLKGYRVIHDPRVHAIHDAQELSRGRWPGLFALRHLLGLFRYFLKHRYLFRRAGLYRRIESAQAAHPATASDASIPET